MTPVRFAGLLGAVALLGCAETTVRPPADGHSIVVAAGEHLGVLTHDHGWFELHGPVEVHHQGTRLRFDDGDLPFDDVERLSLRRDSTGLSRGEIWGFVIAGAVAATVVVVFLMMLTEPEPSTSSSSSDDWFAAVPLCTMW